MDFPLPKWLLEMPDGPEKERAFDKFLLQLACIYTSREGRIYILADAIGVNYTTLKSQIADARLRRVPETTWRRVARLLGPNFVPAESRRTRLVANG